MNSLDKFHNWRRKLRWNRHYKNGRWDRLKDETEAIRYEKIIDFIKKFGIKNPRILDVGCGEGILCHRLGEHYYSHFLGVDFSSISLEKASRLNLKNSEFVLADIHKYVPKETFDVIVFNEVFYYIQPQERANVLKLMIDSLTDKGTIIVSLFKKGKDCWTYFEHFLNIVQMETVYSEVDKIYWKIGVYKK